MEATRAQPASLSLQTAGSCLLVSPSREATRTSGWRGTTGASDDPEGDVCSRGVWNAEGNWVGEPFQTASSTGACVDPVGSGRVSTPRTLRWASFRQTPASDPAS